MPVSLDRQAAHRGANAAYRAQNADRRAIAAHRDAHEGGELIVYRSITLCG